MNSNWFAVNKTFGDFRGELKAGMVLDMGCHGFELVGTINELNGVCDCCTSFRDDDTVVRYRMITWDEE